MINHLRTVRIPELRQAKVGILNEHKNRLELRIKCLDNSLANALKMRENTAHLTQVKLSKDAMKNLLEAPL